MPLSPTATRDLLDRLGHHPKRALGQNFLVDANIVIKSVQMAQVSNGEDVVEVGPGLGTLTEALLETGARVWAVEQDKRLADFLRTSLAPRFPAQFDLLDGDAIEFPLAAFKPSIESSDFKIVANLPYAISTPWMDEILHGPLPNQMVLMLQLEAAQRYAAKPGTKQFGPISIVLQSAFDVAPGHRVSAACFHPRPAVESHLMHLVRKQNPFIFDPTVHRLMRECFQQRRKQIGTLLRGKLNDDGTRWIQSLRSVGLEGQARPEQIPISAWQTLVVT
jgi:16S rRNA (adenine1518-N6/adenine1519-N6)-dimethyltransferase